LVLEEWGNQIDQAINSSIYKAVVNFNLDRCGNGEKIIVIGGGRPVAG